MTPQDKADALEWIVRIAERNTPPAGYSFIDNLRLRTVRELAFAARRTANNPGSEDAT